MYITLLFVTFSIFYSHGYVQSSFKNIIFDPVIPRRLPSLKNILYGDKPLLLIQNQDPNKQQELTISESDSYGLYKILHDSKRRASAGKPLYKVGSTVYVRSGIYRCSRATVLANRPGNIGEEYKVLVALDCRDSRGMVRGGISRYHGTSVWISEANLTEDEIYHPLTAPLLAIDQIYDFCRPKTDFIGPANVYHSQLINTLEKDKIEHIYRKIKSEGYENDHSCFIALTQLARSYKYFKEYGIVGSEIHIELISAINTALHSSQTFDPILLVWAAWSISHLISFQIDSTRKIALEAFESISKRLDYDTLSKLDQSTMSILASAFKVSQVGGEDVLYNIAQITSLIPLEDIIVKETSRLADAMFKRNVKCRAFFERIRELILGFSNTIGPISASFFLSILDWAGIKSQKTVDKLTAIFFANEGFGRPSNRVTDLTMIPMLQGVKGDKELLSRFLERLQIEDPVLNPRVIGEALQILQNVPQSKNLKLWLLGSAMKNFANYTPKRLGSLLFNAARVGKAPHGFSEACFDLLRRKSEGKILSLRVISASLEFLQAHNGVKNAPFLEYILKQFETSLERCKEELENGTLTDDLLLTSRMPIYYFYCLNNLSVLGLKLPKIARLSSIISRSIAKIYCQNAAGLNVMAIERLDKSLFEAASNIALESMIQSKNLNEHSNMIKQKFEEDPSLKYLVELLWGMKKHLAKFANCDSSMATPSYLEIADISSKSDLYEIRECPEKVTNFRRVRYSVHWPFTFLLLLTNAKMINGEDIEIINSLYSFCENNLTDLKNADVNMLYDALTKLELFDNKWDLLIKSIPRGIDRIMS